jgi:diguanylate cyclase (GGDEF)-like protein
MVALFLVLGAALTLIGVQVNRAVDAFIEENHWVIHTLEIKQAITTAVAHLRDAEANQRAHVIAGNQQRLEEYQAALPKLMLQTQQLAALVAGDPAQRAATAELIEAIDQRQRTMAQILAAFHQGGLDKVRGNPAFAASREEDRRIDAIAQRILTAEDAALAERQQKTVHTAALTRTLTLATIGFGMLVLMLALVLLLCEQKRRLVSERRLRTSIIELAQSLEESRRLGHTLRQFSDLGAMLQGCRSLDEAVSGIRLALASLMPDCAGSINLINASQTLVESFACWGAPAPVGEALFAPDDCWALRRGQPHPLAGALAAFQCNHLHGAEGHHLCVPLMAQGEMLGTLTLWAEGAIPDATHDIAVSAAEQISLALASLKLQDTLRTQSLRDPLTGLFNRRYLEASLERELLRAARRSLPTSVLMLDIDHFKRFNDNHGHDAGDALLAQFGAVLTRTLRTEDIACRYGGEEFTVILHETGAADAAQRAEEIGAAVRGMAVQHKRQTLGPITVSIGIATYPQDGTSCAELLQRADRALYAAKHAGRNQVRGTAA